MENIVSIVVFVVIIVIIRNLRLKQHENISIIQSQISSAKDEHNTKVKLQDVFFSLQGSRINQPQARLTLDNEYKNLFHSYDQQIKSCKTRARIFRITNIIIILVFVAGTLYYQTPAFPFVAYERFEQEQHRKEIAVQLANLKSEAENGSANAQFELAQIYRDGSMGENVDYPMAIKLFKAAYQAGNENAGYELTKLLISSNSSKAHLKGVKILTSLASKGYIDAQYDLGIMYYRGNCVKQNNYLAVKWLQTAAEKGHGQASFTLREINTEIAKRHVNAIMVKLVVAIKNKDINIYKLFSDKIVSESSGKTKEQFIKALVREMTNTCSRDNLGFWSSNEDTNEETSYYEGYNITNIKYEVNNVEISGNDATIINVRAGFDTIVSHSSNSSESKEYHTSINAVLEKNGSDYLFSQIQVNPQQYSSYPPPD